MEERGITPRQPRQPPGDRLPRSDRLHRARGGAGRRSRGRARRGARERCPGSVAQTQGGRPVKWLGDGVMFHFSDAGRAIQSGLDLVEQTEQAVSIPARIGIDAGAVIVQEGDYFGRTVNVAARIADYAGPHQVLVSERAMQSAGTADVEFELVGDVRLKGLKNAVRLHKATRADG